MVGAVVVLTVIWSFYAILLSTRRGREEIVVGEAKRVGNREASLLLAWLYTVQA